MSAARTLLAVIGAGVLATLAGLIVLAADPGRAPTPLGVRADPRPWRRGHHRRPAQSGRVAAGRAGRRRARLAARHPAPRRARTGTAPYAAGATVLVTLALPLATLAVPTGGSARRDLVRVSPSARRLTAEVFLLVLAVLAAVLLRRRGLDPRRGGSAAGVGARAARGRRGGARPARVPLAPAVDQPARRADPGQRDLPRHRAGRARRRRRPAGRRGAGDRHRRVLRGRRRRRRRQPRPGRRADRPRRRADPGRTLRPGHRRRAGTACPASRPPPRC